MLTFLGLDKLQCCLGDLDLLVDDQSRIVVRPDPGI